LFISNNRISDFDSLKNLKGLNALTEVNMDGNPISKLKYEYAKNIIKSVNNITLLDHKSIDVYKVW